MNRTALRFLSIANPALTPLAIRRDPKPPTSTSAPAAPRPKRRARRPWRDENDQLRSD